MENETQITPNWLIEEQKRLELEQPKIEERESLIFVENETTEFEVDFSKPFDKYVDKVDESLIKKIIPVTSNGLKLNLWLNVKNPLYREIIDRGVLGQTVFQVKQEGNKMTTRYILIK